MIVEDNFKNSYTDLNKYYFVIFKYNMPLDAPVSRLSVINRVEKNNSFEFSYTYEDDISYSYEKTLSKTISNKNGFYFKSGIEALDIANIEASISYEVTKEKKLEESFSKTYSVKKGYTIKTKVLSKNYDAYYSYDIRARFDVYKIVLYELLYDQSVETHKNWFKKKYLNRF